MDADTLRLILLIAGLVVILGIYLWDRRKKSGLSLPFAKKNRQAKTRAGGPSKTAPAPRKEPVWEGSSSSHSNDEDIQDDEFQRLDEIIQDEVEEGKHEGAQAEFSFAENHEDTPAPTIRSSVPAKIIQINVLSKKQGISGDLVMRAARDVKLLEGEMQIFHFLDERDRQIFSMASLVEPGTFPLKNMSDFITPGVILFCQLSGQEDGLRVFEAMLGVANRLAALFEAELHDETHSVLTKQTIDHICEEIVEHQRQVKLAQISEKQR
ncbi:MAG: hypothetical protein GY703_02475 [Gammaproteobacteria bacterium]|nr:hypothetical protein [Gammaproteobacteria bacterium]